MAKKVEMKPEELDMNVLRVTYPYLAEDIEGSIVAGSGRERALLSKIGKHYGKEAPGQFKGLLGSLTKYNATEKLCAFLQRRDQQAIKDVSDQMSEHTTR